MCLNRKRYDVTAAVDFKLTVLDMPEHVGRNLLISQ